MLARALPPARRTASLLLAGALALGVSGCGEEGPVDDGSYSSLQAGAPDVLAGLGITLISLDEPTAADPNLVDGVLATQGLEAGAYAVRAIDGLSLEPERIAGLLGLAGNIEARTSRGDGRFVVLCFDRIEAALVFAESDPEVFADPTLERDRTTYVSGNLVSFYAPVGDDDATDRFRRALDALAGTGAAGPGTDVPPDSSDSTDSTDSD